MGRANGAAAFVGLDCFVICAAAASEASVRMGHHAPFYPLVERGALHLEWVDRLGSPFNKNDEPLPP